jgi:D-alanyl-D-alanine carboxypeptidase
MNERKHKWRTTMNQKPLLLLFMSLLICAGILSFNLGSSTIAAQEIAVNKTVVALGRTLQRLVTTPGGPPGAIAVVQQGEEQIVVTRGVSNLISGKQISVQDHMRIASTAKAYSGAAALSLVDQGILSLDDRISTLLPDLPNAWGQVTLEQLLNHTSGLPDFTKNNQFRNTFIAAPHKEVSPRQLLKFIQNEGLKFPPGSRYEYSNTDNIVVGLMCEAASRISYEEVLQLYVFDRLGLSKTSLPPGFLMPGSYIRGYEVAPNEPTEDVSTIASASWAWASGGIVSTPHDMNQFIRGLCRRKII